MGEVDDRRGSSSEKLSGSTSARQMGQEKFPCLTFLTMQLKWKEWEHSAVKMSSSCPLVTSLTQMAQFFCTSTTV